MEHIEAAQSEEIIIEDVFEDNADEIREVNERFVQDRQFKGTRRDFTIFNKSQLSKSFKSFKNKRGVTYRINLRYVNQEPERHRRFAWRSLQIAAAGFVIGAIPAGIWHFTRFNSVYLLVASILFFVAAVIALLLFFYRSSDTYVYRSAAADVPLIELDYNKPSHKEFDDFVHALEAYIRQARSGRMTEQQMLAGELKDIRRLMEEGMLDEESYVKARTLIFKHKNFST